MPSKEDLLIVLPGLELDGSSLLFDHFKLLKLIHNEEQFENMIKGLHLIELKYREMTASSFGFGSPSSTSKVLSRFSAINPQKAKDLEDWILETGGNYYLSVKQ